MGGELDINSRNHGNVNTLQWKYWHWSITTYWSKMKISNSDADRRIDKITNLIFGSNEKIMFQLLSARLNKQFVMR